MFRPIACIFSNSAVQLQVCFNKVELSSREGGLRQRLPQEDTDFPAGMTGSGIPTGDQSF